MNSYRTTFATSIAVLMALLLWAARPALAQQDDRPKPAEPTSQVSPVGPAAAPGAEADHQPPPARNGNGAARANQNQPRPSSTGVERPPAREGMVQLAFDNVSVDQLIPFIVQATGKVVIPVKLDMQLKNLKITLINDKPVQRAAALDLVFHALRLNGVGVIEGDDVVILDTIEHINQIGDTGVITADEDIMGRADKGLMVIKIFKLKEAPADSIVEKLTENPPENVVLTADTNSNQIVFYGNLGVAQQFQRLINELDQNYLEVRTETFRLAYADATEVDGHIWDLFEDSGTQQQQQPGAPRRTTPARNQPAGRAATPGAPTVTPAGFTVGPRVQLRTSVSTQQNSVTVSAEPEIVAKIGELIYEQWDLPRGKGTSKVYRLVHTDPLKVEDMLLNLLGQGSGRAGGRTGAVGQQAARGAAGAGGPADLTQQLGAIYRIRAFPDSNSLIVLSKTQEALGFLDYVIDAIDQPSTIGVPLVVELKHANAISLAEELNVLLAEAGAGTGLDRPATGLTGQGLGGLADSGTGGAGDIGAGRTGTTGGAGGAAGRIDFPWQRARGQGAGGEPQSPESPLIGKVRIVPIVRQNALAVVAPVEYRDAVVGVIKSFDRPGRQVMISAIIAEVQLIDDLALGLRFGSDQLVTSASDNTISGNLSFGGTTEGLFGQLFDTSMLDTSVDINVLVQALSQKTNVKILQEPRVFTADNQEAYFFDGQDVPFITDSINNGVSGLQQSFDYKAVGVILNVRPRITAQRDIDLEINLELSSVVPGATLFGGAILDRRQTTTQVIVKNGQTIVLSGILKDTESKTTRGLPLLSDIPLLGELFKSRETNKTTVELVAFITPVVVDNPSENDRNFNQPALERLDELRKPIKGQEKRRDEIRDRILDPKREAGPMITGPPEESVEPESDAKVIPPSPSGLPPVPPPAEKVEPEENDEDAPRPEPVDVDELNEEPDAR